LFFLASKEIEWKANGDIFSFHIFFLEMYLCNLTLVSSSEFRLAKLL